MSFLDRVRVGPLAPLPPEETAEEAEEELQLTLVEHLSELRGRILASVIGLVVTTAVAFLFTPWLVGVLLAPAPASLRERGLIFTEPTEAFFTYFQIALYAGVGLASPWLLFQIGRFVFPALTKREKAMFWRFLPLSFICFCAGVTFGYTITLPFALRYLLDFTIGGLLTPYITVGNYMGFVTAIVFWMGIAFQTPLIVLFLTKINVVTVPRLVAFRKYAVLGAFVIAALITPTPDPLNQALVAIPLWFLYETGIILARIF